MERMCQCPASGKPHFYSAVFNGVTELHVCVNALHRASLISTYRCVWKKKKVISLCQCPASGKPHFYTMEELFDLVVTELCQCPASGKPHFYSHTGGKYYEKNYVGVNALHRASLIST